LTSGEEHEYGCKVCEREEKQSDEEEGSYKFLDCLPVTPVSLAALQPHNRKNNPGYHTTLSFFAVEQIYQAFDTLECAVEEDDLRDGAAVNECSQMIIGALRVVLGEVDHVEACPPALRAAVVYALAALETPPTPEEEEEGDEGEFWLLRHRRFLCDSLTDTRLEMYGWGKYLGPRFRNRFGLGLLRALLEGGAFSQSLPLPAKHGEAPTQSGS